MCVIIYGHSSVRTVATGVFRDYKPQTQVRELVILYLLLLLYTSVETRGYVTCMDHGLEKVWLYATLCFYRLLFGSKMQHKRH